MAVLVLERAQCPVGAHPGGVQPVPDHAQLVQQPDPLGRQRALVAVRALAGEPGAEREPVLRRVPDGHVEVAVRVVIGAGVPVPVPPRGGGAGQHADAQRVQGRFKGAGRGEHGDPGRQPRRRLVFVRGVRAGCPGGAEPGGEGFVVGAHRADHLQHGLVPPVVALLPGAVPVIGDQGGHDDRRCGSHTAPARTPPGRPWMRPAAPRPLTSRCRPSGWPSCTATAARAGNRA